MTCYDEEQRAAMAVNRLRSYLLACILAGCTKLLQLCTTIFHIGGGGSWQFSWQHTSLRESTLICEMVLSYLIDVRTVIICMKRKNIQRNKQSMRKGRKCCLNIRLRRLLMFTYEVTKWCMYLLCNHLHSVSVLTVRTMQSSPFQRVIHYIQCKSNTVKLGH